MIFPRKITDTGYITTKFASPLRYLELAEGEYAIELKELKPGEAIVSRILVESPRGRICSIETDRFESLKK